MRGAAARHAPPRSRRVSRGCAAPACGGASARRRSSSGADARATHPRCWRVCTGAPRTAGATARSACIAATSSCWLVRTICAAGLAGAVGDAAVRVLSCAHRPAMRTRVSSQSRLRRCSPVFGLGMRHTCVPLRQLCSVLLRYSITSKKFSAHSRARRNNEAPGVVPWQRTQLRHKHCCGSVAAGPAKTVRVCCAPASNIGCCCLACSHAPPASCAWVRASAVPTLLLSDDTLRALARAWRRPEKAAP